MQKRDNSIDILRGIGIILMIMGHSSFGTYFEEYKSAFNMAIFFFFSGFFFRTTPFPLFLKRKAKTILLPFVSFATLTVIICMFVNVLHGEFIYPIKDLALGIIWSNQGIFPITGAIWFLQCLFILEIIFWLFENKLNTISLILSVMFLYGMGTYLPNKGIILPFSLDSSLGASAIFASGYLWKKMSQQYENIKMNYLTFGGLFILNVTMIFANGNVNPRTCTYGNPVLFLLNSLVAIAVYWHFSKELNKKTSGVLGVIKNILSSIGKNSIVYLGLNQLIIKGFMVLFESFVPINYPAIKVIRSVLCVFVTVTLLHFICKILFNTKLKVLIGK